MRVCVSETQIWSRSYCLKRPSDYSIMSDHNFPLSKLGHILQTHSPCLDEAIYPTWLVVVSHYVLSVSCILSKPPHDCWFMLVSYPSILASNPGMFFYAVFARRSCHWLLHQMCPGNGMMARVIAILNCTIWKSSNGKLMFHCHVRLLL